MIELSKFPEALYDASLAVTNLALYGYRIGDEAAVLDRRLVTATVNAKHPDPAELWPDAFQKSPEDFTVRTSVMAAPDYYYFLSKEQVESPEWRSATSWPRDKPFGIGHEWRLADRIAHVIEFGGKLMMGEGSFYTLNGYRIKEGRIVMIDLDVKTVPFLTGLSSADCIRLFGKPDYYHEEPNDEYAEQPKIEIGYTRGIFLLYEQWMRGVTRVTVYPGGVEWINAGKLATYDSPYVPL